MSDSQRATRRPPVRRIILFMILALPVLAFILFRWSGEQRVEQALEAIRAEGYPVTLDELDAWYAEPPLGENAADMLAHAFKWYVEIEPELSEHLPIAGTAEPPGRTDPLPEDMKQAIAQHLENNLDALEFLYEGAAIPECRWPIDLTQNSFPMDHVHQIRTGAYLLMLEAMYKAERGDSGGATDAVVAMIGLARSLDEEPTSISQSIRAHRLRLGRDALEQALNRTALTEVQLARLQRTLREAEDAGGFVRGFVGNRCLAADVMQHGSSMDDDSIIPTLAPGPARALYEGVGLNDFDTAAFLELYAEIVEAAKTPPDDRLDAVHTIDELLSELPQYWLSSRYFLQRTTRQFESDLDTRAQLRAARVGLAVERHRVAHGELPESLDTLVPEFLDRVPKDPFGDGPLKYERLENGFMVYSIGVDEEDDGGKEPGWIEERGKYWRRDFREADLTFAVQRAQ